MLNTGPSILAAEQECLQLLEHRKFAICYSDFACSLDAISSTLEVLEVVFKSRVAHSLGKRSSLKKGVCAIDDSRESKWNC